MKLQQKYIYWTLFLIPALIVVFIIVCMFFYISEPKSWTPVQFQRIYWSLPLFCLEIAPILVFVSSLLLVVKQSFKLRYTNLKQAHYKNLIKRFILWFIYIPKRHFIPFLAYLMILLWSVGWGLYVCALWSNYSDDSNIAEILGYSAMSSLDLFLLDINGNILDNIGHGEYLSELNFNFLKGGITVTSIFCAICSFAFLIKLFVHRFYAFVHTANVRVTPTHHNHLYIFFGINEKSVNLGDSIKNKTNSQKDEGDPRSLLIYIDLLSGQEEDTEGVKNIINNISPTNSNLSQIVLDSDTIYLSTETKIKDVDTNQNIWDSLGLDEIKDILKDLQNTRPQVYSGSDRPKENENDIQNSIHIFFMGLNRDENVVNTRIMAKWFENDTALSHIQKIIYCSSRLESVTSNIEDRYMSATNQVRVKILDDSRLAIQHLRKDIKDNPVSFVEINTTDNPGTVTSTFKSLIVGFGETGRDVFRYLYEFSSFLGDGEKSNIRSGFECHIVDSQINKIKGIFINNSPSIFGLDPLKDISDRNLIEFYNLDDHSESFYNLLANLAESLNYIVVCTGEDEQNITTAVRILNFMLRHKPSESKFKIYVRAYNKGNFSHLTELVKYYNELYERDYLQIFGSINDLYKYDLIVLDKARKEAESYHNAYSKIADKDYPPLPGETYWSSLLKSIDFEFYKKATEYLNSQKRDLGRETRQPLSRADALTDTKRKINENCKNSIHSKTKISIIEEALKGYNKNKTEEQKIDIKKLKTILEGLDPYWENRFTLLQGDSRLPNLNQEQSDFIKKLILNLCKTEHLRWNSSHELQGFTYDGNKSTDLRRKTHNSLTDWDNLKPWVLIYDYLVVETSLNLHT